MTQASTRGHFGVGIYHPKWQCNVGTLLRSAHNFGAAYLCTIGRRYKPQSSDTTNATAHLPLFEYDSVDELLLPKGTRLVGVELAPNARPLTTFCHPERCLYLLGAEDHGLPPKILARCHDVVIIPGLRQCLNVASAGSIVLYDRMLKGVYRNRPNGPISESQPDTGVATRNLLGADNG